MRLTIEITDYMRYANFRSENVNLILKFNGSWNENKQRLGRKLRRELPTENGTELESKTHSCNLCVKILLAVSRSAVVTLLQQAPATLVGRHLSRCCRNQKFIPGHAFSRSFRPFHLFASVPFSSFPSLPFSSSIPPQSGTSNPAKGFGERC